MATTKQGKVSAAAEGAMAKFAASMGQPAAEDGGDLLNEFQAQVAGAAETKAVAKEKVAKAPRAKAEKVAKAPVDRLAAVVEAQANPTMWQFARIAKAIVARTEAGQDREAAFDAVMAQVETIVNGILNESPASSKDGDVDSATKAYFAANHAKSTERARGPRAEKSAAETASEPSAATAGDDSEDDLELEDIELEDEDEDEDEDESDVSDEDASN